MDSRIDSPAGDWALFTTVNKLVSLLLPGVLLGLTSFSGCTTLENRRDLYSPQRVDGPYTRMLRERVKTEKVEIVETSQTTIYGSGVSKNVID